jgi:PAS domain S-box-containing protein
MKTLIKNNGRKLDNYARSLIEASLDPLVTISAEGKITDVNEASVKVTGIPREKLINTVFSNYFTNPKKAREGYLQVFDKGFVADYPLTIKHKNGNLTDVLYNATVYKDDKGNVLGVFAAARDVTAQKQASQYARSLIEANLDPLVTISAQGKITDVNEASIKVTGIPREKLVGTDFSNYFTNPKKAREGYLQVFEKGFVADYPLTIKHINGKLTDVLYNATVYKDYRGNVLGVFAAARDVTEHKWAIELRKVNKELAYQNELKEKRASELDIANKELGFQNREKEKRADELVMANKELAFQNEEKEKRAAELIIANKKLAYQNELKEKRASELIIANKELAYQNELKEKQAGELVTANNELGFQNREKEKRADELVMVNKELAYQNEEKEKRAAEFDIANKELAYQNKQKEKSASELIIANKELAYQNELKEKRAGELANANKELGFQNREKEKRADELVMANKELAYQNEEKEKRAAELIIANKELAYQSELKEKRADELIAINKELEQFAHANKELKQFAYISSHELKEPLRTITNFIQVINEDYAATLDEKIITYLGKIDNSVKRMSILINSLLNFSKLGSNKKLSYVDCQEIIDSVVSDLTAIIASSNARIEVSEMPKLNIYEIEFRQIFQNLITNAIKYRKKGTQPIIQIRSEIINETYRFSVSDNGIGIDPNHFDRIFDIFQRLHNTEAEFEGKGLGLAYCKKIVQLHKGDIWVESELGKGSTFYFTIFPIL